MEKMPDAAFYDFRTLKSSLYIATCKGKISDIRFGLHLVVRCQNAVIGESIHILKYWNSLYINNNHSF